MFSCEHLVLPSGSSFFRSTFHFYFPSRSSSCLWFSWPLPVLWSLIIVVIVLSFFISFPETPPFPLGPSMHWSVFFALFPLFPCICRITVSSHVWWLWPVALLPWQCRRRTGWPAGWGAGSPPWGPRALKVRPYDTPPATVRHWKPTGGGRSGRRLVLDAKETLMELMCNIHCVCNIIYITLLLSNCLFVYCLPPAPLGLACVLTLFTALPLTLCIIFGWLNSIHNKDNFYKKMLCYHRLSQGSILTQRYFL